MRHPVLDNEGLDAIRMRKRHAEPDRHAIILHVKRVAREAGRFCEAIDDFRQIVERVSELFWVWPVAMPEARVIGSDKVIASGKAGEERLEHS